MQHIYAFIYLFHMPLFFFLSGYLLKPRPKFGQYAYKKAVHLLIPYFAAYFLLLTFGIPVPAHGHSKLKILGQLAFQVGWGGKLLVSRYTAFWFLTCLFLSQQYVNFLLVRFRLTAVVVVTLAGLALAYVDQLIFPNLVLPWDANVVLFAAPYMVAGYLWRSWRSESNWTAWLATVGVVLAIWICFIRSDAALDMKQGNYGIPIISLFCSLGCIWWVMRLAKWIDHLPRLAKALSRIGEFSLMIMLFHLTILLILMRGLHLQKASDCFVLFVLVSLLSIALAALLNRFALTRALLNGSERDWTRIFGRPHGALQSEAVNEEIRRRDVLP